MLKSFLCLVTGLCVGTMVNAQVAFSQEQKEHPLVPAIEIAKDSLEKIKGVKDYEVLLEKKELVKGKLIEQQMLMRLREEPFSVYLKFLGAHAGRETLFVAGKNNNQIRARESAGVASLIGTMSLDLDSPMVTAENRHPITQIGIRNLLTLLIKQWEMESKYGEIDVKFYPNAKMGDIACEVIQVTHPLPRKQFKYHITRLFIDKKTRFPIRIANYGFPEQPGGQGVLMEEYTYSNFRPNIGLGDLDFSEDNPQYSFK